MNANEISPKIKDRLNKIKIVSRIVRYVALAYLLFSICCCLLFLLWLPSYPQKIDAWLIFVVVMCQFVLCVWYWKLAQLFHFYERGLIFAAGAIRCIKVLGLFCVINWLLGFVFHLLPKPSSGPGFGAGHTKAYFYAVTFPARQAYHMGFFSNFDFGTGIGFGLLVMGVIIFLIAWIMDEGRKIQEEQELTV
jgi:hypothetical protein